MVLSVEPTKKRFVLDVGLSSIAYALPVIALYFFVQPGMAAKLGGTEYGIALTLFTLTQFFDSAFVGAIGNVRLLRSGDDSSDNDCSRFLIVLLFVVCAASIFALAIIEVLFGVFTPFDCLLMSISFIAMSFFDYFAIEYRVQLSYRQIVISNLFLVIGFGIGYLSFCYFGPWEFIFIMGYMLGFAYVLPTTKPWKCRGARHDSKGLIRQFIHYAGSNISTSFVAYGDRIVLFPMLGAFSVSLYASAAVASKVINFITVPLGNVLLSYLVKVESMGVTLSRARKLLAILLIAMVLTGLFFFPVSRFLTALLYPQWCNESLQYIPIIISAICISCYSNLLNTVVMRFVQSSFQLKVSVTRLVTYLVSAVLLTHVFGLYGFCFSLLVAEAVRFLMLVIRLFSRIRQDDIYNACS